MLSNIMLMRITKYNLKDLYKIVFKALDLVIVSTIFYY